MLSSEPKAFTNDEDSKLATVIPYDRDRSV